MEHYIVAATYIEANSMVSINKWETKIWIQIDKKPWILRNWGLLFQLGPQQYENHVLSVKVPAEYS